MVFLVAMFHSEINKKRAVSLGLILACYSKGHLMSVLSSPMFRWFLYIIVLLLVALFWWLVLAYASGMPAFDFMMLFFSVVEFLSWCIKYWYISGPLVCAALGTAFYVFRKGA